MVRQGWLTGLLLLTMGITAAADVFTLWPRRGSGRGGLETVQNVLNAETVFDDPVEVNGAELKLRTALVRDAVVNCLLKLRTTYPQAVFEVGGGLVRVTIPQGDKLVRVLLAGRASGGPVIVFGMEVPAQRPAHFDWPAELPLPGDGRPVGYQYYPNRGLWSGQFRTVHPAAALSEMTERLTAAGWELPGGSATDETSGVILIRKTPAAMVTIKMSSSGLGTVVLRKM